MSKTLLIIFIVTYLHGCKTCPQYNKDLLSWQPYQVGDTVRFESADNDSIIFEIIAHNLGGGERYKGNCECVCKVYSTIHAVSPYDDQHYFNFTMNIINDDQLIVEINESFFSCTPDFDSGTYHMEYFKYNQSLKKWDTADFKLTSRHISGKHYPDVIEIEVDTNIYPHYSIYKIFVADDYGMVSFIEKETNREFHLKSAL